VSVRFEYYFYLNEAKSAGIAIVTASIFNEVQAEIIPKSPVSFSLTDYLADVFANSMVEGEGSQ
jgi:hypothetical protein